MWSLDSAPRMIGRMASKVWPKGNTGKLWVPRDNTFELLGRNCRWKIEPCNTTGKCPGKPIPSLDSLVSLYCIITLKNVVKWCHMVSLLAWEGEQLQRTKWLPIVCFIHFCLLRWFAHSGGLYLCPFRGSTVPGLFCLHESTFAMILPVLSLLSGLLKKELWTKSRTKNWSSFWASSKFGFCATAPDASDAGAEHG